MYCCSQESEETLKKIKEAGQKKGEIEKVYRRKKNNKKRRGGLGKEDKEEKQLKQEQSEQ